MVFRQAWFKAGEYMADVRIGGQKSARLIQRSCRLILSKTLVGKPQGYSPGMMKSHYGVKRLCIPNHLLWQKKTNDFGNSSLTSAPIFVFWQKIH
jgi:hypothetical protein